MVQTNLDEFYVWGTIQSRNNFDVYLWNNFHVAVKGGRIRWIKTARCLICKKEVGWSGCTGNLRKHITLNHPEVYNKEQSLMKRINMLSHLSNEDFDKVLHKLASEWASKNSGVWKWGGTEYPKHYIWNFFSLKTYYKRYVRCEICDKEVYWNQTGLEKLKRHYEKVHLEVSENKRNDILLRFAFRFGKEEFLKLTDKE